MPASVVGYLNWLFYLAHCFGVNWSTSAFSSLVLLLLVYVDVGRGRYRPPGIWHADYFHCQNCLQWTLSKPVCHSAATESSERWIPMHLFSLYQRFMTLSQMNVSRPHTLTSRQPFSFAYTNTWQPTSTTADIDVISTTDAHDHHF